MSIPLNMSRGTLKAVLDVLVTTAVGFAAVLLIWRAMSDRASAPPAASKGAVVEDVETDQLVTHISGAPTTGDINAPVVLIEYSDFECPFCARFATETFPAVQREFIAKGSVQYVFRDYPLERIHPSAIAASHAADCADQQGHYLKMRDDLFKRQRSLSTIAWGEAASQLGLNREMFQSCMGQRDGIAIRAEKDEGVRLGVRSTPTFLIGRRIASDQVRIVARLRGAAEYKVFKDMLERATSQRSVTSLRGQ